MVNYTHCLLANYHNTIENYKLPPKVNFFFGWNKFFRKFFTFTRCLVFSKGEKKNEMKLKWIKKKSENYSLPHLLVIVLNEKLFVFYLYRETECMWLLLTFFVGCWEINFDRAWKWWKLMKKMGNEEINNTSSSPLKTITKMKFTQCYVYPGNLMTINNISSQYILWSCRARIEMKWMLVHLESSFKH